MGAIGDLVIVCACTLDIETCISSDQAVDFSFIHERVKHLYSEDNGRPALEPVGLFKLLLLGYLYCVRSERQLMRAGVVYRWGKR